jgi:hypothetical protein
LSSVKRFLSRGKSRRLGSKVLPGIFSDLIFDDLIFEEKRAPFRQAAHVNED